MDEEMKKIIIISVFVLSILLIALSMAFHERKNMDGEWNREYGGGGFDDVWDIKYTSDGNFVIAGSTTSFGNGNFDAWLLKIDKNGNEIWNKTYGGIREDSASSVVETEDGYVIGGDTLSYGDVTGDFWLIKTDKNGNEIWNRTYDKGRLDHTNKIIKTEDGYVMVGETYHSFGEDGYQDPDIWVIKVDKDGNMLWNKTFGGNLTEFGNDVIETEDGYLVSGITFSYATHGGWDAWLIKLDKNGNEMWNKTYGWEEFEIRAHVIEVDDGYLIAGDTEYMPMGGGAYLIKVDKEGNEIWSRGYGGGLEEIRDIKKVDGGYVLLGSTLIYDIGWNDVWLLKVDEEGNEIWNKSFGGRDTEGGESLVEIDGYYYIAGDKYHKFPEVNMNTWIIKCADSPPPKIKIVRPKENYVYIFDREIMPYNKTLAFVIGGITVVAEVDDPSVIDRVEFYVALLEKTYEYEPGAVLYNPPYEWKWNERAVAILWPAEITAGAYYGNAGAAAVDKVDFRIINLFAPSSSQSS